MCVPRVAFGYFIVLALGLAASNALASQKTFTVVVQDYNELPPYSTFQNDEYGGFNRELLDLFAQRKGYTFEYKAFPVKRLFHEFVNGVGDLKYPDNENWAKHIKKDTEIHYSDPVVTYVNGVLVKPDNLGKDLASIQKLGLVAGWTPIGFQEQIADGSVRLSENNSYAGLLKQVIAGRIDGAYSNVATSNHYLSNVLGQPTALVFDQSLPHVRSARVLSSTKHPELIEEFNEFLEEEADAIDELKLRHAVEAGVVMN
ncbi:ABC-type amino acid transport substrate-binding protein [Labrenzia sp. EL_208]|nr:ABC-type amino acid transport substrate-binding protein [Labrenzia sp. EL_132]MBG6232564.1 ABC-type amino acid transport substrate-binding protein [Labrenzia sp. EL_208]